ncbi:MAG: non-canonical purine NTP pyrophosphatase, partial [Gammaproteobacteria bacterium]|nr:non-canonical purine NTP pyrophosphatase [Gammaproteobacteria bacterium]
PELGLMSAELEKAEKSRISHRGKALALLQQQWQQKG